MKAYGYAREINDASFYKEPPLPLADQYAAIQQFWKDTLVPAGYTAGLEIFTEKGEYATTPFRQRPWGMRLFQTARRHDAIICPRLSLLFLDWEDFWEHGGHLHRRRALLYCLDCLPAPCADSGKLMLAVMEPLEQLHLLTLMTRGKLTYDEVCRREDDGVHPVRKATVRRLAQHKKDMLEFYERQRRNIELMIHLQTTNQWSLDSVRKYLVANKLCRYLRKGKRRYWRLDEMEKAVAWYKNQKPKGDLDAEPK